MFMGKNKVSRVIRILAWYCLERGSFLRNSSVLGQVWCLMTSILFFGFLLQLLTIFNRGRIGFYSGEPRLLFEDAKRLKPTLWTTVPRILLRIYEGVQKKIGNSELKKRLFAKAVASKIQAVDAYVDKYILCSWVRKSTFVYSKS